MAATTRPRTAEADLTGVLLAVIAAALILPGILAFVAPGAFYDQIAGYPPRNDHFLRDLGAFQIGLGGLAFLAWLQPQIRRAAYAILALHFALHTISHVIDVSNADPAWQGPLSLVFEALATAVLVVLFVRERR